MVKQICYVIYGHEIKLVVVVGFVVQYSEHLKHRIVLLSMISI